MSEMRKEMVRCALMDIVPASALEWILEESGFVTAPASAGHHGAYDGGLADHSIMVADALMRITERMDIEWQRERSPMLVGMLHDICKADQYRKLETPIDGRKYEYVKTEIEGHGEKSVIMLKNIMELTEEEEMCIRWHMGAFDERENWSRYTEAVQKYESVLWTHTADMIASQVLGL